MGHLYRHLWDEITFLYEKLGADDFRGPWSSMPFNEAQAREEGVLKPAKASSNGVLQSFLKRFAGRAG
jgi:hypothetical protein